MNWLQLDEGLEGMSMRIYTKLLNHSIEQTLAFLSEVRKDLRSRGSHTMYNL